MKCCLLFLISFIQFFCVAQKAATQTSLSTGTSTALTSSVTSDIIDLPSLNGSNYFVFDTKAKNYVFLYSYKDFKQKLETEIAAGDDRSQQREIINKLDNYFATKDTLTELSYTDPKTTYNFKIFFATYREECWHNKKFIILEKTKGKAEKKLIHKYGQVIHPTKKIKGRQDEYFLSDGVTSIYGNSRYIARIGVKKK